LLVVYCLGRRLAAHHLFFRPFSQASSHDIFFVTFKTQITQKGKLFDRKPLVLVNSSIAKWTYEVSVKLEYIWETVINTNNFREN
jgi:hypothetical protein